MKKFCKEWKNCGTRIYRTDKKGEITLEINGKGNIIKMYKVNDLIEWRLI